MRAMEIKEGWEYAFLGSSLFHISGSRLESDLFRRRRFVRELIRVDPSAKALFSFGENIQQVPRMCLKIKGETL